MDTSSVLGDDDLTVCLPLDVNNEETQVEIPVETMDFRTYQGLMSALLRDVETEVNHGKEQFHGILNKIVLVSETIATKKNEFMNKIQNVVHMTNNFRCVSIHHIKYFRVSSPIDKFTVWFSAEVTSYASEAVDIADGHAPQYAEHMPTGQDHQDPFNNQDPDFADNDDDDNDGSMDSP